MKLTTHIDPTHDPTEIGLKASTPEQGRMGSYQTKEIPILRSRCIGNLIFLKNNMV